MNTQTTQNTLLSAIQTGHPNPSVAASKPNNDVELSAHTTLYTLGGKHYPTPRLWSTAGTRISPVARDQWHAYLAYITTPFPTDIKTPNELMNWHRTFCTTTSRQSSTMVSVITFKPPIHHRI